MPTPNIAQLKQALAIAEQIQQLESEFARIVGGSSSVAPAAKARAALPIKRKGRRTMSAEAREKIAAAQRARWAKAKGTPVAKSPASTPGKKKRKLSPEGRARIVAALKARWAATKKAQK